MAVWESFTNQEQWKVFLKDLVKTNDKALLRAVVLIYDNQIDEEKDKGKSIGNNSIGFDKIDAEVMSKIAKKIKSGQPLTKKELATSRIRMQKYWRQLMIISKDKMKAKRLQEQKELEEEVLKEKLAKLELFREHSEILRKCSEEGIACSFGICDECPVARV